MKHFQLVLLFILLFQLSCKKDPVVLIDSKLKITLWETIDSTKRTLQLICATEKVYNAYNYGIRNSINISSNKIDIYFEHIIMPDFTENSFGPARAIIDLGEIPNGTYDLELRTESEKSVGKLVITTENYSINIEDMNQFQFLNSPLNRVPKNTIWGTSVKKSYASDLTEKYLDSIQILGAAKHSYLPGEYGYFHINTKGQISQQTNQGSNRIPYIYNYSGNSASMKKLVENFGKKYGDSVSIILYTTRGEIFRSWN